MIHNRLWLSFLAMALCWSGAAQAQENKSGSGATGGSGGTSAPSSPTPPSSASAPASSSGIGTPPPSGPIQPSTPSAGSSATGFGTGIGTGTPAQTNQPAGTEIPGGTKPSEGTPTSFSISTGYGRAPEVFVFGEGRLTRPKFQTRVSASIGFDDNIFQTPTDAKGTPDIVIQQQVSEGTAAQVVLVPVRDRRPQRIGVIGPAPRAQEFRQVIIPGTEPQFEEIVIPGTPKPKRQASAISRETLSFEAQTATRRSVFTFDFNLNADYYWNRPKDKEEYNGSMAIRYLHRFTSRLQMTASADVSYLSQPDLTQINTPTTTGNGNYLVTSSRVDLLYRWRPRFSTLTSLTYNGLNFEDASRQGGDYWQYTIGNEFRYLWSPKLTVLLEGRYSHITYDQTSGLDSTTYFALLGGELNLSRRTSATARVGASFRTYEESGGNTVTPYFEGNLNYQLGRASVLSWTNRFGFEEPPDPNTEVLSFRSGVTVTHFFNPRLRGSLSVYGIHRTITNDLAQTDTTEDTLDSSLSFLYTLTRKWTFNLSYNYTTAFFDPADENNYFRNRLFAGFDYAF